MAKKKRDTKSNKTVQRSALKQSYTKQRTNSVTTLMPPNISMWYWG